MNMEKSEILVEVPIELNTNTAVAHINLTHDNASIIAFVKVDFGFITIKGITVKKRDFSGDGHETLVFDLPAYKAGYNYIKSVYISDKRIFSEISNAVIARINEELGEGQIISEEFVDPDEIPF